MSTSKVILDVKGLVTQMYHRGVDPDAIREKDKAINTAAFGFQNWLDEYIEPILKHTAPIDIIACFDGGSDYRKTIFPAYKQNREKSKAEKSVREEAEGKQLEEAAKVFLASIGCVCIGAKGVEADDLIAAVCKGFHDVNKMIYTGDADLLQLADEKTVVFLRNQPQLGDYKGIPLDLIVLNKALVGDTSDGYGGVPQFGPKAWDHMVKTFGLDGMREIDACFKTGNFKPLEEAVSSDKDVALGKLYAGLNEAKLCYRLATLSVDCCYQFKGSTLVWPKYYARVPSRQRTQNVLDLMHCPARIERFEHLFPQFTLVTKENQNEIVEVFLDNLMETPFFAIDYETVDTLKHPAFNEAMSAASKARGGYVDVLSSKITGMSVTFGKHLQHTIYLSVFHKDTDNVPKELLKDFLETMQETGKPVIAQNASFEEQVSNLQLGFQLKLPYDTQILASYVDENDEHGLKALSKRWLNYDQVSYKDTLQAAGAADMAECTGEQVLQYGCDDALVTAHLFKVFQLICRMEGVWDFYASSERAPVHLLNRAFEKGVRIDFNKLGELAEKGREIIDNGFAFLRSELAAHCTKEDLAAAKRLDEADGANLMALDRATGKHTDTALLAKREERRLRWANAAIYKEYKETRVLPEFLGTHTQLNMIAKELGHEGEPLPSIAKTHVNRLVTELRQIRRCRDFADLLGPAANELKSRTGAAFAALSDYCRPFLGEGSLQKEGDELNLNSPKQMQELIYCKLGLPIRRRTKVQREAQRDELGLEGSPSTDDKAMKLAIAEDCTGEHEWKRKVLETIIEVKEQQTMFSLYYNTYPLWVHPRDGMIHPSVRNCGTVTRRPSGSNPNILQVKKGETRQIYLPRYDDHIVIACDFNGQELRITGSEARDPVMIEAYTGGGTYTDEDGMIHPVVKDIHSVTSVGFAEEIFRREGMSGYRPTYDDFRAMLKGKGNKQEEEVAKLVRKYAKMVNFLIVYGGQASTLAMNLGMAMAFCEEIMRRVFVTYPRLQPWQEEVITFAKMRGFIRTAYGTMKHLTADIKSQDGGLRSRQERQAVNGVIQACAADILKKVMTGCYNTRLFDETGAVLIAPVYDEIVASVPIKNAYEYAYRLQQQMNVTPPGHAIPMLAEVSVGPTWGDVVELGDNPSEKKLIACVDQFLGRRNAA